MSEQQKAHAYIIAVFGVEDPEAWAEHHMRKSRYDIDFEGAEDTPASVQYMRTLGDDETEVVNISRKVDLGGPARPSRMPELVW
jgi:hypothetical protein